MIKIPITKILFLDIETVGICKDWTTCQESHPKVSEQFIKYFDWFLKRFPEDDIPTDGLEEELKKINNVYKKRTALVPEFAKIVCVSVAFVTDNGETKAQTFSGDDEKEVLNLPVGSCYIKNFYYPADFSKPKEKWRVIETRLLVHRESGWEALDYIWNDDQSDAKLEVAGDIKKVSWIHYDGSKKEIDYVIPNKNQCKGCHWENNIGIMPIGPKVRNLNKSIAFANGEKNQLAKWIETGILKDAPDVSQMPKMANYNDTSENLNDRSRAYLDINCGHCHRDKGPAYTSGLLLNYDNQNTENLGICKSPVAAGKGTGDLLVDIFPGHPEQSILAYRMKSLDPGVKMPEVGRVMVHTEGVALIEKWITSMTGDCK
jgi:uncharacterized repeat protein (TIGR03806 family)